MDDDIIPGLINDKDDDTASESSEEEDDENDEENTAKSIRLEEDRNFPIKNLTWEQLNRKLEIKFGAKQELENLPRD